MAGTGPGDLDVSALELLTVAVAALDSIPTYTGLTELEGAPERQFVSPGKPAADCAQLSVHWTLVQESPPGQSNTHRTQARANLVRFVVTLYRCVPTSDSALNPPSRDALESAAAQHNADGWALWNHIWNVMRNGDLFSKCKAVQWLGMQSNEPKGQYGEIVLTIQADLEGYEGLAGSEPGE